MIAADAVIRSRRRSIGLQITADARLVVRAPMRASQRSINAVLAEKRDWIVAKLALMRERLRQRPAPVSHVFEREYRRQAKAVITSRVRHYAALMGLAPRAVKVNGARRRWGSCSSTGSLNFSYRLLFAPLAVMDYVVVHELVHMVHLNHSQAFWNRVATVLPNFKQHHRWLKDNGHRL